jgi:beta-fructofuranosidase
MKLGGKGKRKFRLYSDGALSLHIFVDKTAVEAFFQHGEEAASFFLFPEKNIQPELRVFSDADMESISGRVWELDSYKFN